jgi:hypothetical protein
MHHLTQSFFFLNRCCVYFTMLLIKNWNGYAHSSILHISRKIDLKSTVDSFRFESKIHVRECIFFFPKRDEKSVTWGPWWLLCGWGWCIILNGVVSVWCQILSDVGFFRKTFFYLKKLLGFTLSQRPFPCLAKKKK